MGGVFIRCIGEEEHIKWGGVFIRCVGDEEHIKWGVYL